MKRRVFVTGGAHGIGRGIVEAFAQRGDQVVFCDIDPELGARTAAETGSRFIEIDVTDANSLEKGMQEIFDTLGDIDILINNVGISFFKPLTELSIEEFDRVIATNLRPVFITARRLALHRRQNGNRRYGRIVNLCSTRYLQSEAGTEAYSASKGGIYSLTHALAVSRWPRSASRSTPSPRGGSTYAKRSSCAPRTMRSTPRDGSAPPGTSPARVSSCATRRTTSSTARR